MKKHITFLIITLSHFLTFQAKAFQDNEGHFQIDFYTEPTKNNMPVFYSFGSYTATVFSVSKPDDLNESYSVSYIDIPAKIIHSDSLSLLTTFFTNTQMDYFNILGETNLGSIFFRNVNGYPGREYVWSDPSSKTALTRRVFLVKNRLYVLEVTYKFVNEHNIKIAKFLDSFKPLDISSNANPEYEPQVPEKKFIIAHPGAPTLRDQLSYGSFGPQYIKVEMFQVNNGESADANHNIAYGVLYALLPADSISKLSDGEKQDYIKLLIENNSLMNNGGKIISQTESTFRNAWCLESKALILGGHLTIELKTFLVDNYLYQLSVISEPGFEGNTASKKFFESFKFK